jgi:hypothetical protein
MVYGRRTGTASQGCPESESESESIAPGCRQSRSKSSAPAPSSAGPTISPDSHPSPRISLPARPRGVARLATVGGRRQQERRISGRDGVASARRARCGRPARNLWGSPALYSRRQLLAKVAMTASRVASYPCVGERRGCPHGGRRRRPRARQSRRHSTRPRLADARLRIRVEPPIVPSGPLDQRRFAPSSNFASKLTNAINSSARSGSSWMKPWARGFLSPDTAPENIIVNRTDPKDR